MERYSLRSKAVPPTEAKPEVIDVWTEDQTECQPSLTQLDFVVSTPASAALTQFMPEFDSFANRAYTTDQVTTRTTDNWTDVSSGLCSHINLAGQQEEGPASSSLATTATGPMVTGATSTTRGQGHYKTQWPTVVGSPI